MPQVIQPSFAKGELSPSLFGRVDTAAYQIGLAVARNAIVHTYGGVGRRSGTRWIAPVADHSYAPRLVEFQFKTTDSYVLEFGDLYLRFIRDDGHVTESSTVATISGATQADPVVITATAHGFSNNDEVFISGVVGMTELNGNRYYIANVTTNTFELTDQVTGVDVDGTGYTAYTSGGTAAKVYEIETPYAIADVPQLNFTQSADVMTIVHEDYEPRELTRTDHDAWTLTPIAVGPTLASPTGQTVTVTGAASTTVEYRVTAINGDTGEESLTALNNTTRSITAITAADPAVVTSASHGFSDGDEVEINGVVGMTELNGRRFIVANQTTNTFELEDEDSSAYTAYTSGGTANQTFVRITNSAATRNNLIEWTAVADATRYAVYILDNGLNILLGETETTAFTDDNITGDSEFSPPAFKDPFPTTSDNPGAVSFFEQRRVFGGSLNKPDTTIYSQVGNFANFNISFPLQDDDAITATLNSRQVNQIRHYVPTNDLLVFTSGSEWRVNSGPDSQFSTTTIKQKPQSNWGCAFHQPIQIGNAVIWVTENNNSVRSLSFSLAEDSYSSANLNILSAHLLEGKAVQDMCYIRSPESRIYFTMDDGTALSLAYEQEQEVVAWTRLDTDGLFERCASLRGEGTFGEDSVYWVVKRTINGNTVRYIEVMRDTFFDVIEDAYYLDSGLTLDTPITISGVTAADPVVVTATSHGLSNGDTVDISDIVWAPNTSTEGIKTQPDQLNGGQFTIANVTTNTFELQLESEDVDGSAFNAYVSGGKVRLAVLTIDGFEHLIGETVSVLANGNVIRDLTVDSNGIVTLPYRASRVHVGLDYSTDIQTLRIETPEGTVQGRPKAISKVTVIMDKSRGGFWGPNSTDLTEIKQRENEKWGQPTQMFSGATDIYLHSDWNANGQVFMTQRDPLPLNILAIIPDVEVGDV